MTNLYISLYKYRERANSSPLENFLIEALADLLNRLPRNLQQEFITEMLSPGCRNRALRRMSNGEPLSFETQYPIVVTDTRKRPDLAILLGQQTFALMEVKVGAAEQTHLIDQTSGSGADSPFGGKMQAKVMQSQLETYTKWMKDQKRDGWAGAVIFLTDTTRPSANFGNDGLDASMAAQSCQKWRAVGIWLIAKLSAGMTGHTERTLAKDFVGFLNREKLMTGYMTYSDLAAAKIFFPSHTATYHTVNMIAESIQSSFPKSSNSKLKTQFIPGLETLWSSYNLNYSLNLKPELARNKRKSQFIVACGICFPAIGNFLDKDGWGANDLGKLPRHEPFFYVLFKDENRRSALELVKEVPEGWIELYGCEGEQTELIATKAWGSLVPEPDARGHALQEWAKMVASRLFNSIPGYDGAQIAEVDDNEPT